MRWRQGLAGEGDGEVELYIIYTLEEVEDPFGLEDLSPLLPPSTAFFLFLLS